MYILLMDRPPKPQINKETNERYCLGCETWLLQTSEYWYTLHGRIRSNYCKFCYIKKHPSAPRTMEQAIVLSNPYTFKYEFQRQEVHELLTKMGWRWQESGKRWVKPGIVDENGEWENIPEGTPKTGSHILTEEEREEIFLTWDRDYEGFQSKYNITKNKLESAFRGRKRRGATLKPGMLRTAGGKIVYDELKDKRKRPYRRQMNDEEKQRIVELEKQGWDHWDIAKEMDRSITCIRNYIKKYNGSEGTTTR